MRFCVAAVWGFPVDSFALCHKHAHRSIVVLRGNNTLVCKTGEVLSKDSLCLIKMYYCLSPRHMSAYLMDSRVISKGAESTKIAKWEKMKNG